MKNYIIPSVTLALTLLFTGCSCNAQNAKKDTAKTPKPEAVLIIDDVAYYDGCNGCGCVQEAACVCAEKANCACCRQHLKKCPKEMQEKCKAMKKAHCKKNSADTKGQNASSGTPAQSGN